MPEQTFSRETALPAPRAEAYAWHTRPGALERMIPPWADATLDKGGRVANGSTTTLTVAAPFPRKWIARHEDVIPNVAFTDRQIEGPFKSWVHVHKFEPDPQANPNASVLRDTITYTPPGGPLSGLINGWKVEPELARTFDYRHATLAADLEDHRDFGRGRSLTVAVTGSTGLIGTALTHYLTSGGHTVRPVHRQGDGFNVDAVRGVDALVHLAGEAIFQRWDDEVKHKIRYSRVAKTRALCEAIAAMPEDKRPKVMVSGSAVGYYGDRGDAWVNEQTPAGDGFLADVSEHWEQATDPATQAGVRVCLARTGIVLTPRGGALAKMLPAFKLGGGGPLGSGDQYLSWIALDDHLRAVYRLIGDDTMQGPFNLVAPRPVTSRTLAKTLGKVLHRPALMPAPRAALRLAFGEMADAALLASQRVEPRRLLHADFSFRFLDLEPALRWMLGRPATAKPHA